MQEESDDPLHILIADGDPSFAESLASSFVDLDTAVSTEVATTADGAIERLLSAPSRTDGVVVGSDLDSPIDPIRRVTDRPNLPVVLVGDEDQITERIEPAVRAGIADYYLRTTTTAQCKLIAETIADASPSGDTPSDSACPPEDDAEVREEVDEDLFENVTDGLVMHDPDTGEIFDVNERFCEMHGYDRGELVGMSIDEVTAPEAEYEYAAAEDFIEDATEGETPLFEWRNQTKEGETFPVEVHLAIVETSGGKRVLASVRDISERRQFERAYRDIFEKVSDGLVVHDPATGEITEVNDRACELYGRPRDQLVGATVDQVTGPRDEYTLERANELIQQAREEGPLLFEWQGQRGTDGAPFPMEVNLDVVEIQGEERVLASLRDITERKRRKREFEQIFDSVKDGIAVIDPDTGDHIRVNESMCEMTGYDRDEILKMGMGGIGISDEGFTDERADDLVDRVIESGGSETVEWKIRAADGSERWLEVSATGATIGGEVRVVAISRDITESRRTQQRLQAVIDRIDEAVYITAVPNLVKSTGAPDYLSAGYEDIWGLSVAEIRETYEDGYYDTLHPDDRGPYRDFLEGIVDDVESDDAADSYSTELRIRTVDGERRWIRSDFYPMNWPTGPTRIVVVTRDITERKRRQRTLETFHEATNELTAADSKGDACRRAVAAAEEVLGFPLASVHLYDETEGELVSVAATDRLEALETEVPRFGPGDSLPWQVYVDGTASTDTEPVADLYGPGVSGPDIVLPLGTHGVMLVGAPPGTFDDEALELAQVLSATLEAALNHVEGERELEEREEKLQAEQRRANRLKRLNTLIRDIERVTVEQSTRADIEQAVCDRLNDVDVYDLVWIAESTVADDQLLARTSAGGMEQYIDSLTLDADAGAGVHPALVANQHGESETVSNVATDVPGGDWRTTALQHGIQSVLAVPIQHENRLHGILTVEAGEPNAFDEATREVLSELGRSIGYAISVTEREKALDSEGTTELEFTVDDDGLFLVRGTAEYDCRIELERAVRRTGGSFSTFYLVDGVAPESLVELAERATTVDSAQVVTVDDGESGLIEVSGSTWFGAVFTTHGAIVRDARAAAGTATLSVEAPQGFDVRALVEDFQERYPEAELVAQRHRERTLRSMIELRDLLRDELTDHQWEALETAYSAGYFSWPRDASGEEVAELLDVSQPTFNKHLRVAERTAFRLLLNQGALNSAE